MSHTVTRQRYSVDKVYRDPENDKIVGVIHWMQKSTAYTILGMIFHNEDGEKFQVTKIEETETQWVVTLKLLETSFLAELRRAGRLHEVFGETE